ncbi:hypothetical protein Marpi_2061 [Marinitoga piezophila KA3]|uniref:Uncharacterized protein n=1 Tax=Marinitoga piezophila (strain DSM 14283 / JCM 11233 / KA3) TaxID=443254 RepID=H2J766_MARPK|nr:MULTISPECIES: hypothetical protein [Marinitoga]AEX86436.1 hypothetical protein Marpi_2061 [Marinitoga piezophila KA3]APT76824.1 hypothetical protein LN42_10885 [Marinitoga sp. 1137]
MKKSFILLLLISSITVFPIDINLSHLEFLRDTFNINKKEVVGYWIYADKIGNKYIRKSAKEEGVTCVDDVARVAVLYTELYKLEKKELYYERAKEALDFVISMQDTDGDFYNFIFENGKINKIGITSRKSAGWWASRAFWALSNAINTFPDESFNKKIIESSKKARKVLIKNLDNEYLLNKSTDLTSIFLLGLTKYYNFSKSSEDIDYITKIANSILNYQIKDGPFKGAFNESQNKNKFIWHSWGSRQGEALLEVYNITKDKKYLESVKKLVDFYDMLLSIGPVYEINDYIKKYPYLSYGVEVIVSTLSKLYLLTQKDIYAIKAFLFGSFYNGNNHLNFPMYGKNGEGYDGMHSVYVNQNAGAESTVSALLALTNLNKLPLRFQIYYNSKLLDKGNRALLLEAEKMDTGIYYYELDNRGNIQIKTNEKISLKTQIDIEGKYYIYLIGNIPPETKIKIYSGNSKVSTSQQFILANLSKGKLTISLIPEDDYLYLDQILIIPENYSFLFSINNNFYKISNDEIYKIKNNKPINNEKKYMQSAEIAILEKGNIKILELNKIFNNNGIVKFSERKEGNFDNPDGIFGAKYPAEEIGKVLKNGYLEYEDILFKINIDGKDNIICSGQELKFENLKGNKIYILGSSEHGSYIGKIVIEYNDGTTQIEELKFSDWCQQPVFNEKIVVDTIYRYNSLGIKENINPKIFLNIFTLKNKEIKSIYLPKIPTMHIFAITIK